MKIVLTGISSFLILFQIQCQDWNRCQTAQSGNSHYLLHSHICQVSLITDSQHEYADEYHDHCCYNTDQTRNTIMRQHGIGDPPEFFQHRFMDRILFALCFFYRFTFFSAFFSFLLFFLFSGQFCHINGTDFHLGLLCTILCQDFQFFHRIRHIGHSGIDQFLHRTIAVTYADTLHTTFVSTNDIIGTVTYHHHILSAGGHIETLQGLLDHLCFGGTFFIHAGTYDFRKITGQMKMFQNLAHKLLRL